DTETITASLGASGPSAFQSLSETAGPATAVAVSLNPSSIPADGSSSSLATAKVTDAHGNKISNQSLTFSTNGDVQFTPVDTSPLGPCPNRLATPGTTATATTDANGQAQACITASTTAD